MQVAMTAPQPTLGIPDAIAAGKALFGVQSDDARNLGSERDQAWMLTQSGKPCAILKVSNVLEDPEILDLEEGAARHAVTVDPALPIVVPWPCGGIFRGQWQQGESLHWVRCYNVMPGAEREKEEGPLPDVLLQEWGGTLARLGRALRGFFHPRANRPTMWDVQNAWTWRPLLSHVTTEGGLQSLCCDVLEVFDGDVRPLLPSLRHQVVHGDFNMGNVLVRDGHISAILDFGDMAYTALAVDVAASLCSLSQGHRELGTAELLRMGRVFVDGYQKSNPLEEQDLKCLADLWMLRVAAEIIISSWRVGTGIEEPSRTMGDFQCFPAVLRLLHSLGKVGRAAAFLGQHTIAAASTSLLIARRDAAIGTGTEPLSYGSSPLVPTHGEGCWIIDEGGRRYLDCYNNVPCVGHGHPRVALAIGRQALRGNFNLRYLHPLAVTLAERLKKTLPPSLDTVCFVNSGSEANDLAWRMAACWTGHKGALCTAYAYHGITEASAALSPETAAEAGHLPAHVERWEAADLYRGKNLDDAQMKAAIARLKEKGMQPAMAILDGVMQSDGVLQLTPSYVQSMARLVREAGGLWCADEVQGGHGRAAPHMWSFEQYGVEPDFVTMGKPMGNGYPVAAVVTRREIAAKLAEKQGVFFSTFGGNPVSCAAAHAVLDVMEDERVLLRAEEAGRVLREATRKATASMECIGDVRGVGLATGIEIVTDRTSKQPDAVRAGWVKQVMRELGVLVGTTGPSCNVLKVRPPLALTGADVPVFVNALVAALEKPVPT